MASSATLAQLKVWVSAGADSSVTWTATDDTEAQLLLDAATAFIAQYTGRTFAGETAATKYFYPTSRSTLDLPDIRTVASIAYDSAGDGTFATTLSASTDYYRTPLNPYPDAGIYTGIRLLDTSATRFDPDYRIRVIGDWGYVIGSPVAVPANVQTACLMLAARWRTRKGAPLGIVQNTDIGTFRSISKMDFDVQALLDPYRTASASGGDPRGGSGIGSIGLRTATASRGWG